MNNLNILNIFKSICKMHLKKILLNLFHMEATGDFKKRYFTVELWGEKTYKWIETKS